MTTVLAIYAAVAATVSVCWQVYTWWHGRQIHVTVKVSRAYFTFPNGQATPTIQIKAISRTGHDIRATNAGLRAESMPGQIAWVVHPHPHSSIPGVIRPYDSAEAYIEPSNFPAQGIDLSKPIRAVVSLSTGEQVWSSPTTLAS